MGRAGRYLVAAAAAMALLACGSTSVQAPREVAAGEAQNGQSIQLRTGDVVQISLTTTFWTFAPASDEGVVGLQGEVAISPAPIGTCPPGTGCGVVLARYKALKAGTTTVSASRVSCGEALRCTGPQGSYSVTIVVT